MTLRTKTNTKKYVGYISYGKSIGGHCFGLYLNGTNGAEIEFPRTWDKLKARVTVTVLEIFKECPHCKMSYQGGYYKYCPHCGTKLERMGATGLISQKNKVKKP